MSEYFALGERWSVIAVAVALGIVVLSWGLDKALVRYLPELWVRLCRPVIARCALSTGLPYRSRPPSAIDREGGSSLVPVAHGAGTATLIVNGEGRSQQVRSVVVTARAPGMTPELTVRVGPGVVLLTSATLVFPLLMLLMPRGSTPWPPVWLVLGLTNVLTWTVLRRDGRTALRRCLVLRDPILELAADADGADGRFADGS